MDWKRYLVCVLIVQLFTGIFAIVTETASLSDFLFGTEPAAQYDNWLSHLAEGIANPGYNVYAPYDRQSNGFGDFRIPDTDTAPAWDDMLFFFIAGEYQAAQDVLDEMEVPFQIVEFHDTDSGRTFYMIREIPDPAFIDDNGTADLYDDEQGAFTYGWGLFIYNPGSTNPTIITIPHPCDDYPSPAMGYQALTEWNARYLLINGAGREVAWTNIGTYDNSKSLSDPTRNASHPFHKAYIRFADEIRVHTGWREFSAQLHTYDSSSHIGYANCQISAGYRKDCPNLPIRDLSWLKHDLINQGSHIMVPANEVGNSQDVLLNSFYAVSYNTYEFTFSDGINAYAVNSSIDLPAYSQNNQMLYTQAGLNDFDVYEPFFHIEMDELPNVYGSLESTFKWFYGWDAENLVWDMDSLFSNFVSYYGRWIEDMAPVLTEMFSMNDGLAPTDPANLTVINQTSTSVTLGWSRSSSYDFETYEILYASEPIGADNYQTLDRNSFALLASQAAETVTVTGLTESNPYYFRIRAKDKNSQYSDLSNEVWINVQLPHPVFSVLPASKNFGTVVAGTPASQIFTVSNSGTGLLQIDSISLDGADAEQFLLTDNNAYPLSLGAGESIAVNLSFLPGSEGTFSAFLNITDNLNRETHIVNLAAVCTDVPNHGGGDISTTAGGYYFANNLSITAPAVPDYSWIYLASNAVNPSAVSGNLDDGYWGPVALGFNFSYYGNIYNEVFVSSNGFLKFDSGASQSNNAQIPSNPNPDNIIALFWDNLEYYPGISNIYFGSGSSSFVITYDHLGRSGTSYDPQNSVTAQVLLYPDGRIKMQYQEVTGTQHTPTIGIENSTGNKGVQYHCNGTGGFYTLSGFRTNIAVMFGTNEYTLPVELSAFSAYVTLQNHVTLNWTTQTETGLSGFYLYRGQDALLSNALRIPSLIAATNTSQETNYSFTDMEAVPGHTYHYWLESVEISGESEFHGPVSIVIHGQDGEIPAVPSVTMLLDAYPNPFQTPLHLPYKLAAPGTVAMRVYDVKGRLIWSKAVTHNKAGQYQMLWTGSDMNGKLVCSGVYFYRMSCGNYSDIKKVFLLK